MEIRIELNYGPISAEIQSDADESYGEVMEELASFIEEHDVIFSDFELNRQETSSPDSAGIDSDETEIEVDGTSWSSLVEETEVSEEKLEHLFDVSGSYPQLLVAEHITGSNNDQMEEATLLLLAVWENYYGNEKMKTGEITECLRSAGFPHENYSNIYQRQTFNRFFVKDTKEIEETGGTTSVIGLTQPGRNQAYRLIRELSEEIDA